MRKILYPGTFDPITKGHINLVERAVKLFDSVVVAIANSDKKQPLFSLKERIALCEAALSHLPGVSVCGFSHLLVDLVKQHDTHIVLRGVRASSDFEYELQLANMNRAMFPEFETVFLTPADDLGYISSSLVREIASMRGEYAQFVSPDVEQALLQKFPK